MSTDSTTTLDYWTPVAKTANERYTIERDFGTIFRKAMNDRGLTSSLRAIRKFSSNETSTEGVYYTLDTYHHRRSLTTTIVDALLTDLLGNVDPSHYIRTPTTTEFMYEGVHFVLYHLLQGTDGDRGAYIDVSTEALFFGYNRIVDVFNIILRNSGFYIDEFLNTYFKSRDGRNHLVSKMGDTPCKLLGMKASAYSTYIYSSFRNVGEILDWFLEAKFVNLASLHINADKQYVGPDDYFGSELFRDLVQAILLKPMSELNNSAMQPATITRKRFETWESTNGQEYKHYTRSLVFEQQSSIINSKLTNELIIEAVETDLTEVQAVEFRKIFEVDVSAKEDYAFFVLSSSEETLKKRIKEEYQKLTT